MERLIGWNFKVILFIIALFIILSSCDSTTYIGDNRKGFTVHSVQISDIQCSYEIWQENKWSAIITDSCNKYKVGQIVYIK